MTSVIEALKKSNKKKNIYNINILLRIDYFIICLTTLYKNCFKC